MIKKSFVSAGFSPLSTEKFLYDQILLVNAK